MAEETKTTEMLDWARIDSILTSPTLLAGPGPEHVFDSLRAHDPVHWTDGGDRRGFWAVTRYADCLAVFDDPHTFSSSAGTSMPPGRRDLSAEEKFAMGFDAMVVTADPPRHMALRRPFNKHFSVPAVARLHEVCEEIIDNILDDVSDKGEAEFVEDIAAQLPANLFLAMLGVPESDWSYVRILAKRRRHAQDIGLAEGADAQEIFVDATRKLYEYVAAHTMKRRHEPTDDFASLIANMEVAGSLLDEREAGWMAFSLIAGGLETTRNAAAIGVLELIRNPDQARALQDTAVATSAVEEVLRWATPSKSKLRIATTDTELGGKRIAAGDWVVLWLNSANRDEEVFVDAGRFDVLRSPNKHLTFAAGEHHCLGRNVARLELRLLLPRVFAAFPDLSVNGEVEWAASDITNEIKRLPVAFPPRTAAP